MEFVKSVINTMKDSFTLITDETKSYDNLIVVRSDLETEDEAKSFVKRFSFQSNTSYIVQRHIRKPVKVRFSKRWLCQQASIKKHKNSKRSTACNSSIHIVIKKINVFTIKNDPFLRLKQRLPCVIKINPIHSHFTDSPDALRMLRVPENINKSFFEYFDNGMTPTQSKRFHENKIIAAGAKSEDLVGNNINPSPRHVSYLYFLWKKKNCGLISKFPLDKLKEKHAIFHEKGVTVIITDSDPWAVLVVTPIMRRAQSLQSSREFIYICSVTDCKKSECTLTFMLTVTKAGAMPIAAFIHCGEAMENYLYAFNLLKVHFCFAFGEDAQGPQAFLTNDSSAQKAALLELWPNTAQFLCYFHVTQTEWKWLEDHKKSITGEERRRLFNLFENVVNAISEEDFQQAIENINMEKHYPNFVHHFNNFLERKEEWVLFYRAHLLTQDHNTHKFAEVTMRILKDVFLCKTKAYNAVALVDYLVSVWEIHTSRKLTKYAHDKINKGSLYRGLSSKLKNFTLSNIIQTDLETFVFPSEKTKHTHTVNVLSSTCTCLSAQSGGFCKHQSFIYRNLDAGAPEPPVLSPDDRYDLATLSLGEKCPTKRFFFNHVKSEPVARSTMNSPTALPGTSDYEAQISDYIEISNGPNLLSSNTRQRLMNSMKNLEQHVNFVEESLVEKFIDTINNIDSSESLADFISSVVNISNVSSDDFKYQQTSLQSPSIDERNNVIQIYKQDPVVHSPKVPIFVRVSVNRK